MVDDVFISAKSADYQYANQVYQFLRDRGVRTFFSQESLPELGNSDYRKQIDEKLEEIQHMVVVVSSVEHAVSPWVEAEWGFFINEKRSGRKQGNLITVTVGSLEPNELPVSLRYYEVIPFDTDAFAKIASYVSPRLPPENEPSPASRDVDEASAQAGRRRSKTPTDRHIVAAERLAGHRAERVSRIAVHAISVVTIG
jgi:hypothetical protein